MTSPSTPMDLNLTPAGVSPDGVYHFPLFSGESLETVTLVMFCVLMPIATITVVFRLISSYKTRGTNVGGIGMADVASVLALLLSTAQEGIVLTLRKYERHQWDVSVASINASYFKRIYAQDIVAWPAIFFAKLAILLLYLRLFKIQTGMRCSIAIGIVWALLTYMPNIAVSSYFCAPAVGQPWDFKVGLHCGDLRATKWLVTSATMSVVLDIYILILPIPVVNGLKMSFRRRFGVLLIFFTAFFAVVCAVLTLVYRVHLLNSTDNFWVTGQLFLCNLVENYIAIIVGAMPGCSTCIKTIVASSPLLSQLTSRFSFSKSSESGGSNKTWKAVYQLKEVSIDTESQRSDGRQDNAGNNSPREINVKTSYDVNYSRS